MSSNPSGLERTVDAGFKHGAQSSTNQMRAYKVTTILTVFSIWLEFVIAASVVLFDPNNNTFPYTKIVLSWPGLLEEVHRVWALVILILIMLNIYYTRKSALGKIQILYSLLVLALFVLQAAFGAITIWSYDYPPFVLLHEGNAAILLMVSSLMLGRILEPGLKPAY
ncbi:MAG: COX15/CtaA family protein [Thermoprotei archaeon]